MSVPGRMVGSYRWDDDAELAALYLASRGIDAYVAHGLEIAGERAYEIAIGASAVGGALAGSMVGLALGAVIFMYTGLLGGLAVGALAGLFGFPPHACHRSFANRRDRFGLFVEEALADRAGRLLRGR